MCVLKNKISHRKPKSAKSHEEESQILDKKMSEEEMKRLAPGLEDAKLLVS